MSDAALGEQRGEVALVRVGAYAVSHLPADGDVHGVEARSARPVTSTTGARRSSPCSSPRASRSTAMLVAPEVVVADRSARVPAAAVAPRARRFLAVWRSGLQLRLAERPLP